MDTTTWSVRNNNALEFLVIAVAYSCINDDHPFPFTAKDAHYHLIVRPRVARPVASEQCDVNGTMTALEVV